MAYNTHHGHFRLININRRETVDTPAWAETLGQIIHSIKTDKLIDLLPVPKLPTSRQVSRDELTAAWARQYVHSLIRSKKGKETNTHTGIWRTDQSRTTTPLTTSLPRELLDRTLSFLTNPADLICLAATCTLFLHILGRSSVVPILEHDAAPWAGERLVLASQTAKGVPSALADGFVRPALGYDHTATLGRAGCPVHERCWRALSPQVADAAGEEPLLCPCLYDSAANPLFSLRAQGWPSSAGGVMESVAGREGLTEEDVGVLRKWVVGGEYLSAVIGVDKLVQAVRWERDVIEGALWMPIAWYQCRDERAVGDAARIRDEWELEPWVSERQRREIRVLRCLDLREFVREDVLDGSGFEGCLGEALCVQALWTSWIGGEEAKRRWSDYGRWAGLRFDIRVVAESDAELEKWTDVSVKAVSLLEQSGLVIKEKEWLLL